MEEISLKDRTAERLAISPPDRALPKEMQCYMSTSKKVNWLVIALHWE